METEIRNILFFSEEQKRVNNLKVMICADLGKELSKKVVSEACIKLNETGIQPLIEKQYKPFLNVDSAVFAESDKIIDECDMFMKSAVTVLFLNGDRRRQALINRFSV